ncbi:unannotated protein [freshwater metagenome]|uniref:Unannotated protein n=1 Tax=freshwater metagenome TaxID=449393 RepID=A0A6J6XEV8_9ZZZZ
MPNAAINKPETPGPISLAKLKFAELRLTAFGKSALPTISAVKLCLTGASIALAVPRANAKKKTCQSFTCSVMTSKPRVVAEIPPAKLQIISVLRLLNLSAIFPPCILKSKAGKNCNPTTNPTYVPLPVICSTNQSCATRCAQVPIFEAVLAG